MARILLPLTDVERRVIHRALNALYSRSQKQIARDQKTGWKPEEGKIDVHKASMETIDALHERMAELSKRNEELT